MLPRFAERRALPGMAGEFADPPIAQYWDDTSLLVFILGLSYFFSILYAYVRDIQPMWGVIVLAMFFLSPVFWYIEDASEILLSIHAVNPLGQIIELGHNLVVFDKVPPLEDWLYASLLVFIVFLVGFLTFKKFEKRVMEEI